MRPRWRSRAGFARTAGGVLVRTPSAESWIGGRNAFPLLEGLRPHLDGRATLEEITRRLDARRAGAVVELVRHLARIGAVEDEDVAGLALGAGLLRDAVAARLPEGWTALLAVSDAIEPRRDALLHRRLAARGLIWLPVRADLGEVWIGPLSGRRPGCAACLDTRLRAGREHGAERRRIAREVARRAGPDPALAAPELARSVIDVVSRWDQARQRAVRLPLAGGDPEPAWLLPVPDCPVCGAHGPGSGGLLSGARLAAVEVPALPSVRDCLDGFAAGGRTGIVQGSAHLADDGLPGAPLARARTSEWAHGSGDTAQEATTIAMLEALERYGGARPRGHRLELARAADLEDRAIDPRRLVLHSPHQYSQEGFAWVPFHPDDTRYWWRAYSFAERRQLAVPADLVFHDARRALRPVPPLACETSSGCAIGGSPAQAALHALLEVLERDAFLLAWYARAPLCRIDPGRAGLAATRRLHEVLRGEGWECLVLDVSRPDTAVPAVWALAVSRGGAGLKTLSGACAHPDPERAVLGAMREVASRLRSWRRLYEAERRRARRLAADPSVVRGPADHALGYACPEAFERLEPLIGPLSPLAPRAHLPAAPSTLDGICSRLVASGFDVLLAELTPADVGELGLSIVRALVPGALPLTFGHGRERLEGASRVRLGEGVAWPHPLS